MPYKKLKDENYKNLGGINVKASTYLTGPQQFLDLRNYCFERTGALQSRPGIVDSVTLAKSTYGSTPTSLYQWNSPNFIKQGPNADGITTIAGISLVVLDSGTNLYGINSATLLTIYQSLTPGPLDFETESTELYTGNLKDYLYFANGKEFRVFSKGSSGVNIAGVWNYTGSIDYRFPEATGVSISTGAFGLSTGPIPSGTHTFKVIFGKALGGSFDTPPFDEYVFFSDQSNPSYFFLGATLPVNQCFQAYAPIPQGYGYQIASVRYTSPLGNIEYSLGITVGLGMGFSLGSTQVFLTVPHFSSAGSYSGIANLTTIPKYLESYKNMLFMAGFSSSPHTIKHSDIGGYLINTPENAFDVLPGQSREITNLTKFQDTLIVFKDSSIYEINGDSPETLSLKTITTEYGCVNNRASVTFQNKLWFVDKKGICEYNGPDTFIVSYAVESYFNDLDPDKFRALHVKSANQVWFASGDIVLVYDYDVKAWTIYDKIPINSDTGSAIIEYGQSLPQPSWITSSTSFFYISRLDQDTTTDRGSNITLSFKTRYHKRLGDTTQEMWRRVFMDIDPGPTLSPTMTINMLPDYGNSIADTQFVNVGPYQTRVDFGVSAKSLAIQTILSAGERITVNGYTIESRYLRST